jgi:hypothetical protein
MYDRPMLARCSLSRLRQLCRKAMRAMVAAMKESARTRTGDSSQSTAPATNRSLKQQAPVVDRPDGRVAASAFVAQHGCDASEHTDDAD